MSETFGQYLARKREAAGLMQAELALRVGVTPTYIGYLEREADPTGAADAMRPMIDVVDAIAGALDVPVAEARCAAGYGPPEGSPASCDEAAADSFDESDFAALHRMYESLAPDERRRIKPLIEILRRELDRVRGG